MATLAVRADMYSCLSDWTAFRRRLLRKGTGRQLGIPLPSFSKQSEQGQYWDFMP